MRSSLPGIHVSSVIGSGSLLRGEEPEKSTVTEG
jgi:hypothetical protein